MNDNNNEMPKNETQVTTPPTEENNENNKKGKFPWIIIFLLLLALAGYLFFSNKDMFIKNKDGEKETPTENIQVVDKENEETKKDDLEDEKDETNTTDDKKTPSNNTTESSNTGNGGTNNNQASSTTPGTSSQDSSEVSIEPSGTILYLYEESLMGMDGVDFQHISSTATSITVDVTINEDTQRYTIPFGQETKISHLKNLIVVNEVTDDDDKYYSITFK